MTRIWRLVFKGFMQAGICLAALALGGVIMVSLSNRNEAPVQATNPEPTLRVQVVRATYEDFPVVLGGWGTVRPRDVARITPEVSGLVTYVHPLLEVGEIVPKGEILFRIDDQNYLAALREADALVNQWDSTIGRLRKEYAIDQERLVEYKRNVEIAGEEHARLQNLYKDNVVTLSEVEAAERSANLAQSEFSQLRRAVEVYPYRITEAESSLAAVRARADIARSNLARTTVRSTFMARVKDVAIEQSEFVRAGDPVLTLANDKLLEISVPFDSREAEQWLPFERSDPSHDGPMNSWFAKLAHVPVSVYWTDSSSDLSWTGSLGRVEKYNPDTHTLAVIISVEQAASRDGEKIAIPLAEGMFCRVEFQGNLAENVVQVPSGAVGHPSESSGNWTVRLAHRDETGQSRLKTVPVSVSHTSGDDVFLTGGLDEGDLVVVTRLANPLEGELLDPEVLTSEAGSL